MGEEWLKIQDVMGQMAHRLTGALAAYVRGSMDAACALETPQASKDADPHDPTCTR